MRFAPELEAAYRVDLFTLSLRARLLLSSLLLIIYLCYPALDYLLFHPPTEFVEIARGIQFYLIVPLLVLTIAASLIRQLSPLSTPLTLIAIFCVAASAMYQRILGHEMGYFTAQSWADITMLSAFFFASIPTVRIVPLCLAILTLNILTEIHVGLRIDDKLALANTVYEIEMSVIMFILGAVGCYIVEANNRLNWLESRDLRNKIQHDGLTGALTRREFRNLYRRLFSLAQREHRPISIALADVDYFKPYNDNYGHSQGDHCLARLGRTLREVADHHEGFVARIGGEEFALLFYGLSEEQNIRVLQQVRQSIENLAIPHQARPDQLQHVTLSIGSIHLIPDNNRNRFDILKLADRKLYEAKASGRNHTVIATSEQYV